MMGPQDEPEFIHQLGRLAEAFALTLSSVQITMYLAAMQEYELPDVVSAMGRWLRGQEHIPVKTYAGGDQDYVQIGRFFPKPAELIYLIEHPLPRRPRFALPEATVCPGCGGNVETSGPCQGCQEKARENLARIKALCDSVGTVPASRPSMMTDVQWEARLRLLGTGYVPKQWLQRVHPDEYRIAYPETGGGDG